LYLPHFSLPRVLPRVHHLSLLDALPISMIVPYVSFIGCVVIKRDLWLNREKDRHIGSEFIHVGVIFQAPLPRGPRVLARRRGGGIGRAHLRTPVTDQSRTPSSPFLQRTH